ncbi:MAG TPA: UDP-N-acetylmuramoyl-L-alanine--D-glutamate ligase [Candidatus Latescibacteria bacterium]|nr:UDP-N-acetylmuramoyl-L-alanine--D-glutamate ligase [Candidatus Latescibacterota bacterium]
MKHYEPGRTWKGARVTVMGLGLFGGGVGAARFAVQQDAKVTVTDLRSAEQLTESLDALNGLPIRYVLGRHEEADFEGADIVIASPAVPVQSPFLARARDAGAHLTTEILLVAERCRGNVIAVTGSNGKTTTTSLIGAILSIHDARTVTGGNLGKSLLETVDQIAPGTPVVLELSSFQLEWLGPVHWYPHVAVITNLTPNHLDRHGTFASYVEAKRQIVAYQPAEAHAVLNARDENVRALRSMTSARVHWFDSANALQDGTWLEEGNVVSSIRGPVHYVMPASEVPLPGAHNLENVLAAVAATEIMGVPVPAIRSAVSSFRPVEHRLELVRTVNGVRYFNDSIATTPESAICALRAFPEKTLLLIAGGYDKKTPFDSLGAEIAKRAAALITVGATSDKIRKEAVRAGFPEERIFPAGTLEKAVQTAFSFAQPGQAVSLSPACASYDQFRNFEERGRMFKRLVLELPENPGSERHRRDKMNNSS